MDSVGAVYVRVIADTSAMKEQIENDAAQAGGVGSRAFQAQWQKNQQKKLDNLFFSRAVRKQVEKAAEQLGKDVAKAERNGFHSVGFEVTPEIAKGLDDIAKHFGKTAHQAKIEWDKNFISSVSRSVNKAEAELESLRKAQEKMQARGIRENELFDINKAKKEFKDFEAMWDEAHERNRLFDIAKFKKDLKEAERGTKGFSIGLGSLIPSGVVDKFRSLGKEGGGAFGDGFNDGIKDADGGLIQLTKRMRLIVLSIAALGSQFSQVLVGASGGALAFVSLIGRASGSLVGLLPVVASVGAGVVTLGVGLDGVASAFKDVSKQATEATKNGKAFDVNAKAVKDALSGLSSNAGAFVIQLVKVQKEWGKVKLAIQDALFKDLAEQITPVTEQLIPELRRGFVSLAQVLNTSIIRALNALSRFDLDSLFAALAPILGSVSDAVITFSLSLLNLTKALAPIGQTLGEAFEGVAQRFSDWVDQAAASGKLQKTMESFLDAAQQMGDVLGSAAVLVGNFFLAGQAGQNKFAQGLVGLLDKWNTWVTSVEGSQAIENFYNRAFTVLKALGPLLSGLKDGFSSIITDDAISRLDFFSTSLGTIASGLGQAIALIEASGVIQAIAQAGAMFVTAFQPVIPALTQLASVIAATLGGALTALAPVVTAIGTAFNAALTAALPALALLGQTLVQVFGSVAGPLASVISTIGSAFAAVLPPVVQILGTIATMAGQIFTAVAPFIEGFVSTLTAAFTTLAPIIQGALTSILPVITAILTSLAPVLDTIVQVITGVLMTIIPVIAQVVTALQPVIAIVGQGLAQAFAALGPLITQVFSAIAPLLTGLTPLISGIVSAIVPVINAVVAAISPLIPVIVQVVTVVANALVPVFAMLSPIIVQLVNAIAPLLDALLQMVGAVLPPLIAAIMPVIDVIITLAATIATALVPIVDALTPLLVTLAPIIVQLVVAFTPLLNIIVSLAPIIGLLAQLLASLLPPVIGVLNWFVQLIAPLISLIIQFASFSKAIDDVGAFFIKLGGIIGAWVGRVISLFTNWWATVSGIFSKVAGFIGGIWRAVISSAETFISQLTSKFTPIANVLLAPFEVFKTGVTSIIDFVKGKFQGFLDLIGKVKGLLSKLPGVGGLFGGNKGDSGMAAGGIVTTPGRRLIGEAGPEAVIPLSRPINQINPEVREMARLLRSAPRTASTPVGSSKTVNNTINVTSPASDPNAVAMSVLNRAAVLARG